MKRNQLFNLLIELLFLVQAIGLLGIFIILPFGATKITMVNSPVEKWSVGLWFFFILSLLVYVLYIIGLWYLRKVSHQIYSNNYFNYTTITSLKKSGHFFVASSLVNLGLYGLYFVLKLLNGEVQLTTDLNGVLPIFILIIGLFFLIQSDVLSKAKSFKEDNELTI